MGVNYNRWPVHKSYADHLIHPLTSEDTVAAILDDMTFDELIGTSEVLVSRLDGINASIEALSELRVKANSMLRRMNELIVEMEAE